MEFRAVNKSEKKCYGFYARKMEEFLASGDEMWETKFDSIEERDTARHGFLNCAKKYGVHICVRGPYLYLERV